MGILVFLVAFPLGVAVVGAAFGALGAKMGDRRLPLPPLWPRRGACFGEPTVEGGSHFGGRAGELFHNNPVCDREYMR